jgi:subtilisin family serine protease
MRRIIGLCRASSETRDMVERRPLLPSFAALLVSVVLASPIHAAAETATPGLDKIQPWLLEHATGNQETEFLVVLRDQADLTSASRLTSKLAKGRFVRDALYDKAQVTQAPLLAWLEERGIWHQSFYIVNAILVRGTIDLAKTIAARPEIDRVEGNPPIPNLTPVQPTAEEIEAASRQLLSPDAIEPGLTAIRAPDVWALGYTGQGIVIGGADTGVRWDHPALINHYRGWNGTTADHNYNWHDSVHSGGGVCGPNTTAPCDDDSHGTHTLGTAVGADATNTNRIGVAPGAKFIACRNMDQGDGTPARYVECMEWFLAPYPIGGTPAQGDPSKAPDLTTNSWGCPASEGCAPATLQSAVEAQRAAGILFVAAAGNSGSGCSTVSDPPSFYDASFTAGAFSASTGSIASFSSRGPVTVDGSNRIKPDIIAPGVSVRSSVPPNGYATASGTSMATPHVAGAIALLWSAQPSLKNQIPATENILDQAAVEVTTTSCSSSGFPNNVYGWGKLDIKAAVDLAATVGVPTEPGTPARGVSLAPALPNPASRSTLLRVRLEREGDLELAIYATSGQRIRTLVHGRRAAGEQVFEWDGLNDHGAMAPAGVYLVSVRSRGALASQKLIWLSR